MATDTFSGGENWVVPDNNSSITIRCYGGAGDGGNATDSGDSDAVSRDSGGDDGGYAKGDLSVTAGETLYIRRSSGGSGGFASNSGQSADGGDGGDGISVRQNGDGAGDVVIEAGGGGGGGAAATDPYSGEDEDTASTGGGGGGGDAEDSNQINGGSRIVTTDGATGGGASSKSGNNGSSATGDTEGRTAAAGGGGGGGELGGEGGNATATGLSTSDVAIAHGTGGGGGDGYTGGVSSTSEAVDSHGGSANVEIDYTPKPNPPENLTSTVDHDSPNITIDWDVNDSITDGFFVYRSTNQGFSPSSSNKIDTLNDATKRSYTDTGVSEDQTYYYRISAYEASTNTESDASNETEGEVAQTIRVWDGNDFVEKPIWRWDSNNNEWTSIDSIKEYDEVTDTWYETSP